MLASPGPEPMLETIDLGRTLPKDRAKELLPPLQERLRQLQYQLLEAEVPTIILFEGWDAAGKGTVIQRLTQKLDPRAFRAWPGSPPSELEQRYHWLWRYQTRLPEDGHMALFDHSWYGRVLVERVEKFVKKRHWRGAYEQINQLERWLVDDGQIVVKFFFHISQKEQARRLKEIEKHPHEYWRVSEEDWRRNRAYDKWVVAIEDMLARTDTAACPWTVVEATDARWTRYRVLETLVARMDEALRHRAQAPAEVSRTHRAQDATRHEREERERAGLALVRDVAEKAGLPLDEET
jgi:polyphosphate kinase 2 (PPK2 family)